MKRYSNPIAFLAITSLSFGGAARAQTPLVAKNAEQPLALSEAAPSSSPIGFLFPDEMILAPTGGAGSWGLAGNSGTDPSVNFLGTMDAAPLELRVDNQRVVRFERGSFTSPVGVTYSGVSTVCGAEFNVASVPGATVAGGGDIRDEGASHEIRKNEAIDVACTVGGGAGNRAGTSPSSGRYATVAGGLHNWAEGYFGTIGGGGFNNIPYGTGDTIGGGYGNNAVGGWSTVGGGGGNSASNGGTVGGGGSHPGDGNGNSASDWGTVGGGIANSAVFYGTVGGGNGNSVTGYGGTIAGGSSNYIYADYSAIAGGAGNFVSAEYSTIGGGLWGEAKAVYATIAGGGPVDPNSYATRNRVLDDYGTIGGGGGNIAGRDPHAADPIGPDVPSETFATVAGGERNHAAGQHSTVPGGLANVAGGSYSLAAGRRAKVRTALQLGGEDIDGDEGTFVWADSTDADFQSTGPNQFLIRADGGVGIGTNSPSQQLHVAGNICATGTIGACSDERFKQHVQPVAGALDKIERLRGVSFDWKRNEFSDHQFAEGPQIGFIAQEVEKVLPQVVAKGSDGYLSVDYGRLAPVLVEAIKEQQNQIDTARIENSALRAEIVELKALVEQLVNHQNKEKP
jgi:hypothetical protein